MAVVGFPRTYAARGLLGRFTIASASLDPHRAMPYVRDESFHEILIERASYRMAGPRECVWGKKEKGGVLLVV